MASRMVGSLPAIACSRSGCFPLRAWLESPGCSAAHGRTNGTSDRDQLGRRPLFQLCLPGVVAFRPGVFVEGFHVSSVRAAENDGHRLHFYGLQRDGCLRASVVGWACRNHWFVCSDVLPTYHGQSLDQSHFRRLKLLSPPDLRKFSVFTRIRRFSKNPGLALRGWEPHGQSGPQETWELSCSTRAIRSRNNSELRYRRQLLGSRRTTLLSKGMQSCI